ncbi:LamB/YcsF family protein [Pseudohalocynthiibacter aestuariivivens]|jgi:5-oxoprolinase (ATP-hydrolysing) subunit A|uniref:5-oxoprolinase subunit A n=1 Tax=Pseudohalocynthiibacter aestuariivivens TaxID=1591409 RepID=A0ABV5JA94_9RHOB|nr:MULTISPECIES: 5-oxoprolinase subunit PxpA [Pseudohalocynthiibacter]MBS9716066.1 LamB/YcsF family protein [Pseudohalocynthiibacter aestuariivivens]MCK0102377.1 LamB/YcsF family protein [Pseudohalocynthiibacter sp. F2068]
MTKHIDLNADMGESFGDWVMGNDPALLDTVTSANIACGFHAGDPDVMAKTMRLAVKRGVGIGAHPGFADLQGFGRRRINLSAENLRNMICYQLGAAQAMARAAGGQISHFKLHGALSNMACEDPEIARVCYKAAQEIAPTIKIMVLASTPMQDVAEELGCYWAGEIFADRAYNDDASLVDRSFPGAVIHDPEQAAKRVLDMVQRNAIISANGKHIAAQIDTICMHGDTPNSIKIAKAVKSTLLRNEIAVRSLATASYKF